MYCWILALQSAAAVVVARGADAASCFAAPLDVASEPARLEEDSPVEGIWAGTTTI